MKLTLYYSVRNGGDGSAYPKFVESEELAEWDQAHMEEGWGEPCTGSITVEGDNLTCSTDVETKEGYYLNLYFNLVLEGYEDNEEAEEFKAEFFPDGLPEFTAKIIELHHYGVFVGKRLVYRSYAYPEKKANNKGLKKLKGKLDGLK